MVGGEIIKAGKAVIHSVTVPAGYDEVPVDTGAVDMRRL